MAGLDYDRMRRDAQEAEAAREFATIRMQQAVRPNVSGARDQGTFERLGAIPGDIVQSYQDLLQRAKEESTSVAMGGDFNPQPVQELMFNTATGAIPLSSKVGANVLGIFGGRISAIADREALVKAQLMAARGIPREEIWNKTGWFQGPEGSWKFEIPDARASYSRLNALDASLLDRRVKELPKNAGPEQIREALVPLSSVFKHPAFERAYPGMLDDIRFMRLPSKSELHGGYAPVGNFLALHPRLDRDQAKSTLLHELQHVVQKREGFPTGATVNTPEIQPLAQQAAPRFQQVAKDFIDRSNEARAAWIKNYQDVAGGDYREAMEAWRQMNPKEYADVWRARELVDPAKALSEARFQAYKRIAGETEARNVQTRAPFTAAQRRQIYPWETAEYPPEGQLVIPAEQSVLPF